MMAKMILQMSLEGRRWVVSEVLLRREGLEKGGLVYLAVAGMVAVLSIGFK